MKWTNNMGWGQHRHSGNLDKYFLLFLVFLLCFLCFVASHFLMTPHYPSIHSTDAYCVPDTHKAQLLALENCSSWSSWEERRFAHVFIHRYHKCLLNTYCVPGVVQNSCSDPHEFLWTKQTSPCHHGADVLTVADKQHSVRHTNFCEEELQAWWRGRCLVGKSLCDQEGNKPCGWLPGVRTFHTEGAASAKALRHRPGMFEGQWKGQNDWRRVSYIFP